MSDDFKFTKYVDGKQMTWDASSLDAVTRCPRYYQYNNIIKYKPKVGAFSPTFGSAVHDAMETFEAERFLGNTKEETTRLAVTRLIRDHGANLAHSTDNALTLEAACRAVVWKIEEYWDEAIRLVEDPEGNPAVETRFEVPFEDTGFRFSGRIDKIITLPNMAGVYIADFKTTKSALTPYFFDRYKLGNQIFAYLWATRRVMALDVSGFVIDGIHTLVNSSRFDKAIYHVTEEQLDEWLNNTRHTLKMIDQYAADDFYPQNYNGCGAYNGCQFRDACSTPESRRQSWLDADFVVGGR